MATKLPIGLCFQLMACISCHDTHTIAGVSQVAPSSFHRSETRQDGQFKALLIGIGTYHEGSGWPSLPSEADVAALQSALSSARYQVEVLTTAGGQPVNRDKLVSTVEHFVRRLTPFDTAAVYVSAHGIAKDAPRIVPSDCARDSMACAVSLDDLVRLIKTGTAKHKLLILDSCYSGAAELGAPSTSFTFSDSTLAIWTASQANEVAGARRTATSHYSIFTHHIVQALKNRPLIARNGGHLSLVMAAREVAESVNQESLEVFERPQHPALYLGGEKDFDLVGAPEGNRIVHRLALTSQRFEFVPLSPAELLKRYSEEAPLSVSDGSGQRILLPFVPITKPGATYSEQQVQIEAAKVSPFTIDPNLSGRTAEIWELFAQLKNAQVVDNRKLRVVSVDATDASVKVTFGSAYYSDYVGTNLASDLVDLLERKSMRDELEPGPRLRPLRTAKCANHLGITALVTTSDGKLFFARSSNAVASFPETLVPGVSASCDFSECGPPGTPFSAVVRRAEKELGILSTEITELRLIGFARELRRSGKPEAYFHFFTPLSFVDIQERVRGAVGRHQKDSFVRRPSEESWQLGDLVPFEATVELAQTGAVRVTGTRHLIALLGRPDVSPSTAGALGYYLAWSESLPPKRKPAPN